MENADLKRQQMLNDPVELLVCKMAVPTIITMLITSIYNMADTYFVGQLDTLSTAAVGLALPLMNVIQAIGFFFGHGSGNYISRKLGSSDIKAASVMSDTAVIFSLIMGTILCVSGLLLIDPLVVFLGATKLLMQPSREYISILLIGVPFVMTSFTMNNQLRFQGNAFRGMVGMGCGSILNIILDPIFIYVLGMGVKGAAAATVTSQMVSFSVLLYMSGRFPFRKPDFVPSGEIFAAIFKFGTPSLARQGIMSIAAICMNHAAGNYSEAVIAAVSVVNKIVMVGGSVIIGFGQGFQPVCGFNFGAERYDRVKKTFSFCIKSATVFSAAYSSLVFIFSGTLIGIFRDDPEVIAAGIPILRMQCITGVFQGVIVMTNMIIQNMGKTFTASFLAVARQGIFFIPLLYILSGISGLAGVQMTQSAADLCTAAITIPITVRTLKQLDSSIMLMDK